PWYVRNLLEAHDPTPPAFNFVFKRPDPIFTKADGFSYTADRVSERKLSDLLLLPLRFFTDPESKDFWEWGVTAMVLLLYAPFLFLVAQLCRRNRWRASGPLIYLSVAAVYLPFPWLFSSLGRYSLHWYPMLAAWVGVIVSDVSARTENLSNSRPAIWLTRAAMAVFCVALIIPTPSAACMHFYYDYCASTASLVRSNTNLKGYLKKNFSGYLASQAVIATLVSNQKSNTKIFLFPDLAELTFYFRKAKIISVGDYLGPARYSDLSKDIEQGNCLPYLTRLDISAVMLGPHREENRWSVLYDKFRLQLKDHGFSEYRTSEDNIAIFLRRDIAPSRELTRLTQ